MRLQDFTYDEQTGVFISTKQQNFCYNDGDKTENYILNQIKKARDLSDGSDELSSVIKGWASHYHLAPGRTNILRALNLPQKGHVLELGSGCGAITRYLGELGYSVDAIEGSYRRATITKKRCRDLNNVDVYCSDFNIIEFESKYDIVTLIGVLEYAPIFARNEGAPHKAGQKLLKIALSALKPDGILILAIENRIGLKYWSGCPEDHTGVLYDGIHGYPRINNPHTWTRGELKELLTESGFGIAQWFSCFPDYKFAATIINDDYLEKEELISKQLHNWIQTPFPVHGGTTNRVYTFNESLAIKTLSENGILPEFANSFLIIANHKGLNCNKTKEKWLIKNFSTKRKKVYCTVTTLIRDNKLLIKKQRLFKPEPKEIHIHNVIHIVNDSEWFQGDLLRTKLQTLLNQNTVKGNEDFISLFSKYTDWLLSHFSIGKNDEEGFALLERNTLDLIPRNIIDMNNNEYFDLEWQSDEPLPIDFVIYRALKDLYSGGCYIETDMRLILKNNLIYKLIRELLPHYTIRRHRRNIRKEIDFQHQVELPLSKNKRLIQRLINNPMIGSLWNVLPNKLKDPLKRNFKKLI